MKGKTSPQKKSNLLGVRVPRPPDYMMSPLPHNLDSLSLEAIKILNYYYGEIEKVQIDIIGKMEEFSKKYLPPVNPPKL
jgi:hypothetical protein